MAAARRTWTRDELLAAFNLYCRTPFGRMHSTNPDVVALANALDRTPGSVAMKLVNFASLDPVQQARGVRGLKNVAAADRDVFDAFQSDWEGLAEESESAAARLGWVQHEPVNPSLTHAGPTEVLRMAKSRRAQGLFRAAVLASYGDRCAISGIAGRSLLQASHIVPWAVDPDRRLDPRNGIALSALHDRAFDRGLITLDEDLRVVVSRRLHVADPSSLHQAALLQIEGHRIRMPTRYAPDSEAIVHHRTRVFVA